jgi:hypothetical protein
MERPKSLYRIHDILRRKNRGPKDDILFAEELQIHCNSVSGPEVSSIKKRSMIVRVISNFVKACSEAYGQRLNVFCENFIKCEDTIKTLGSANKGEGFSENFNLKLSEIMQPKEFFHYLKMDV